MDLNIINQISNHRIGDFRMSRNKIGIITLFGYFNYGNRYQNYAVQEIIKNFDYDVKTIVVYGNIKPIFKTIVYFLMQPFGSIKAKRYINFYKFSKKHIPIQTLIRKDLKITNKISEKYHYFVAGSDQIWNPLIRQRERDNFFLRFAERKQRICISPSFGVSQIPPEYVDDFINGLNGFEHLCSRETDGAEIIKNLTGRDAEVLIDPTLALDMKQWSAIFSDVKLKGEKYIIKAILGDNSSKKNEYIEKLARQNGLEIIDIFNHAFSPEEVLYLISKASIVCTDSFHFTAFSINFNTPFIVFQREGDKVGSSMYSRLTSLLGMFHLEARVYPSLSLEEALNCDFSISNKVLQEEREKIYKFVEMSLKISQG